MSIMSRELQKLQDERAVAKDGLRSGLIRMPSVIVDKEQPPGSARLSSTTASGRHSPRSSPKDVSSIQQESHEETLWEGEVDGTFHETPIGPGASQFSLMNPRNNRGSEDAY